MSAYPTVLDELIEAAEIRRDQWAAAASGKLDDDDTFAELYEADEAEACWQIERYNRAIELAKTLKAEEKIACD